MHTKSLFALTVLLLGAPSLTACTIEVSDGDDTETSGRDASTTKDNTSKGDTRNDGGASGETDDTLVVEDGGSDRSNETTASDDGEQTVEGDAGDDNDTTNPADGGGSGYESFKSGSISLMQMSLSVGGTEIITATASAGFGITTFASGERPNVDIPCETTTVGNCTLLECETSESDAGGGEGQSTYTKVSAGTVKITGLSEDLQLKDDGKGTYTPVSGTSRLWSGGEKLVASAPGGGEVPEFSIELDAPSSITVTSPALELGEALNASRSSDLELEWQDGEEGEVTVYVIDVDDTTRTISCTVPADAGGVVIDESLLSDFGDEGALSVTLTSATTKVVDGWSLSFSAGDPVVSAEIAFED